MTATYRRQWEVPLYDQLRDPLPDGRPDPFATSDCGWECAAMVIAALRPQAISAGCLRAATLPDIGWGESTGYMLAEALDAYAIRAQVRTWPDPHWKDGCRRDVDAGRLNILLGNWVSPNLLHWVLVVGYSWGSLVVNDPWHGVRRNIDGPVLDQLWSGVRVLVTSKISTDRVLRKDG